MPGRAQLSTHALPNLLKMPIQDLRNLLVRRPVSKMPAHPPKDPGISCGQAAVHIDMIRQYS